MPPVGFPYLGADNRTDVEPFVSKYGGITVSFTINLRQQFTFYTGDDLYGQAADVFPYNAKPQFIYDMFHYYKIGGGHAIKMTGTSDAFLKGGLGSSAAAGVATIAAISRIKNISTNRDQIAEMAWIMEQNQGWFGGKQDQYAAAYGGMNVMDFTPTGVKIVTLARYVVEPLTQGIVLFWTGEKERNVQKAFKEPTKDQIEALLDIKEMAIGSIKYIANGDWYNIGKLMDIYWKQKKKSNPAISNDKIDKIYDAAKKAGALGGKLLGSGTGGYMMFFVDPNIRTGFLEEMAKVGMENIDFSLDSQGVETRIV